MKTAICLVSLLGALVFNPTQGIAQVPLPEVINIVAPGPDVPPEIAAFSGRWKGDWDKVVDYILIVEQITQTEARVISAWGDGPEWKTKKGYRKFRAKVIPGDKPRLEFGGDGGVRLTAEMGKDLITINMSRESAAGMISETKLNKVK